MPWIFLCLMLINATYFGWKFMDGAQPQPHAVVGAAGQQGKRIQLLSENPVLLQASEAPEKQEPAEAESPKPVASLPQCFNVGPFTNGAALQRLVGVMRAKHFFVRVDKRKVDERDYWVFIPAFTNREKAEEKLRDLKARGIQGFVVKEGVFINAISLNHFSQKDLAQSFLQQMQASGVTVEYRELSHAGFEQWAYLAPNQSGADLKAEIDEFVSKEDGLRREITACEE